MNGFWLSRIAQALNGELHGEDVFVHSVCTDSRQLVRGDLFVALQGPHFDGHDYLPEATRKGAVAALVKRSYDSLPCVRVDDTRIGLGRLGALWRQASGAQVVGITGSNGKTTVKEMVAAILSQCAPTVFTQGNLNNDIGLPLTLCRLRDEAYAVVEMGANHPGEIAYLSHLAQPDVAVLNNAGPAHLEGFGSIEGVAKAKIEIIEGLKPDGCFVYYHDDAFAAMWRARAEARRLRCLSFGRSKDADVRLLAERMRLTWHDEGFVNEFQVETPLERLHLRLPLAGQHNVNNALAAIAVATALSIDTQAIVRGLGGLKPVTRRLQPKIGAWGGLLLDDSYNANPASVTAAIELLAQAPGRKILVLGDLAELGEESQRLHGHLGELASQYHIDCLLSCGRLSAASSQAFAGESRHFTAHEPLIAHLQSWLAKGDTVLIKGSRSAHMERVADALCGERETC